MIKALVQKDYYRTEVSVSLPANVSDVDEILKSTKTSGKMVVLYNDGHIQGINVEQNSKINDTQSAKIKEILGLAEKVL